MLWPRAAKLRRVSSNTPVSDSNATPSASCMCRKIQNRVLHDPANGSIATTRFFDGIRAAMEATSRPMRSASGSRVHSTPCVQGDGFPDDTTLADAVRRC